MAGYHASLAQTNTFPGSGNVGIGTTTPGAQLEISEGSSFGSVLADFNGPIYGVAVRPQTTGGWARGLNFLNSSNTGLATFGAYGHAGSLDYAFIGASVQAYASPWMTFKSNGNVGINTTNPSARLSVLANTNETGYLMTNGAETRFGFYIKNLGSNGILSPAKIGFMAIKMVIILLIGPFTGILNYF